MTTSQETGSSQSTSDVECAQLAMRALESYRGDDLYRARAAFRAFTPEQMQEQHGVSGKTRAEILAGYEAHNAAIDAAMRWVRTRS
jgi:hypothetical protein